MHNDHIWFLQRDTFLLSQTQKIGVFFYISSETHLFGFSGFTISIVVSKGRLAPWFRRAGTLHNAIHTYICSMNSQTFVSHKEIHLCHLTHNSCQKFTSLCCVGFSSPLLPMCKDLLLDSDVLEQWTMSYMYI